VSARRAARSQPSSSAGAMPATVAGSGRSRSPVCGQRRPQRTTIRRSIAHARSKVMSCSHTAHASASKGAKRRVTRRCGLRRTDAR
jgi:hypothetical protein